MTSINQSNRTAALATFNEKLAAVKTQNPEQHREAFPNFAAMDAAMARDVSQRKADAEARSQAVATRNHVPKTTEEYRGPGSKRILTRCKNEATDASQLSVPLKDTIPMEEGKRLGKKTCDE